MSAADDFTKAVFSLIDRNQDYVDRRGVNSYSRETDRIINSLIVFYNQATGQDPDLDIAERDFHHSKLMADIERLKTIIRLLGVDPGFFTEMDGDFLSLKLKKSIRTRSLPVLEPVFFIDLETDYLSFQTDLSSMMIIIKGFRFALENDLPVLERFYRGKNFKYMKKYFDIIENYPDLDAGELKRWITRDYINGSITTDSHPETDRERTTAETG